MYIFSLCRINGNKMLEGRKELECSVEEPTDNQLIEYTVR